MSLEAPERPGVLKKTTDVQREPLNGSPVQQPPYKQGRVRQSFCCIYLPVACLPVFLPAYLPACAMHLQPDTTLLLDHFLQEQTHQIVRDQGPQWTPLDHTLDEGQDEHCVNKRKLEYYLFFTYGV